MNSEKKEKEHLRVWLLREGEPLPGDARPRLMRTGLLAEWLAGKGHEVTWWCSTFNHQSKTYRSDETTVKEPVPGERLVMLHSGVRYRRNVSPLRILYLHSLSRQFAKLSLNEEKPDIIISSFPSISFARAAVRYGRKNNVPVIIDARDRWPDIFINAFPKALRPFAKVLLFPMELYTRNTLRKADALTGVQSSILSWALRKAGREAGPLDRPIHICFDDTLSYTEEERAKALSGWAEKGVTKDTWNVCFYSTLSSSTIDYGPVFEGSKKVAEKHPDFRLVICGSGDSEETLRTMSAGRPEIILPGWCNDLELQTLLSIGNAGLYPFKNSFFRDAVSNKFAGYLAAGLPILTSLEGLSKAYVEENQVGIAYKEGDADDFSRALEILLSHPEQYEETARRARACFERDFSNDVANTQFERLIWDVLEA